MTRVDELQKKYPSIPREVIVKFETLRCGIADSAALDELGRWIPSVGPTGTYNYDHDVTWKELAERKSSSVKPGFIKHLGPFHTRNGLGVRIERDSTSPYEIGKLESGQFAIFEGEERVEDIYFPHIPWPFEERPEPVTSKGTPATKLVNLKAPNCFDITPVRFCEYFPLGEQCKFCNFNASQADARSVGISHPVNANLEETVEAYKILSSEVRLVEGHFIMGGFRNIEQQAKLFLNFTEKMAGAASYKPNFFIIMQPVSRKSMQRLKDAGTNCVGLNMEVWDPSLFAEMCPGKAKYTGYERYKEAMLDAVDIFGAGNADGFFVGGVTMLPPNGHKTWQEARDSMIDGVRWLIKNNVFPAYTHFRWAPGSVYSQDASNRDKLAPAEFFLEVSLAHHEAMKEYGLYQKLNKLSVTCPMDCLTHLYAGDIGMLELSGNIGDWLADAIPEKANYLAKFNASLRSPAKVE